jgi:hypothetical protein
MLKYNIRLEIYLIRCKDISVKPLITKPGVLSMPADLVALRRLRALKISELER